MNLRRAGGFSLGEMLAGLGLLSIVMLGAASMVSWSNTQIKMLDFKNTYAQDIGEFRRLLSNRQTCSMSLTLPNPVVIDPNPSSAPEGVALPRLDLFDNNKVLVRNLASVSAANEIGENGYNVTRMRLVNRGKVDTDYLVDLIISSSVGKAGNKFSMADSSIPLLVKLGPGNEVTSCTAIRREGEVSPSSICASQNMTYDEVTRSCLVAGEIRVEGRGYTLSCPAGYKMEWGEGSCSAEPVGYPLAESSFRLPNGTTQQMAIPGQRPYRDTYLPTNSPDKETCNFEYPVGVTNGAEWYIWTYCIPK